MNQFDNNWWPLVSNIWTGFSYRNNVNEQKVRVEKYNDSPDHIHLLDENEKLKRSQVVQTLVKQEALKNYQPPAIVSAVKEFATEKLGLNESVKELRRKEVTNIKSKVHGSLDIHLIGNLNRELDIQEMIIFLKKQGYLVERYEVIHKPTSGFIFIHPNQINNLRQYG
ncbi:unnamed protein product [Rhizophagus irregularis]|nr:unnamed protein product [Rhizophagus irregularis]